MSRVGGCGRAGQARAQLHSVPSWLCALGQMIQVLVLSVLTCKIEAMPSFGLLLCEVIEMMHVKGIVRCLQ